MNETVLCVVGNVATRPVYRELPGGPSARFRLAVTARYWDREKNLWTDGHTNFFTVWANRQLAVNVAASVEVGQPLVVQGRLKVRTEAREGQQAWASADIDAVTIGHDLTRGTAAFRRSAKPETLPRPAARPEPQWETPPGEAPGDASVEAAAEAVLEGAMEGVADGEARTGLSDQQGARATMVT